ncbi:MAG TPA: helix-turn-helix domain-containing protein [Micavibrio sp.]|nr:helix-turn-helix domain-containing protein [Micavibrio sp.]
MSITTAQIRGARGILNWSQQDLAQRTGISATSIGAIENGQTTPRESTLSTIRKTLENAGIQFLGLEGMRIQNSYVQTYKGADGFSDFLDDVYQTAVAHGTEKNPMQVFLSNVVHENWVKWMRPDLWENHTRRMLEAKKVMDVRIITKEGDWNFPTKAYSQYKWFPKERFNDKSFYSYHDRLAFINFKQDDVEIILIKQPAFAEGYRSLFLVAWDNFAIVPPARERTFD